MKNRLILVSFIFLIFVSLVYSADVEIKGFVNDYAGIIDGGQEQELNLILQQIYDSGVAQYSMVTVKSLEGKDIVSYSLELAQGNLGDSEKDNGLLLLVALEDKKYRFEVGRGIEYILNDAKVGRVGRTYLVPYFQQEDYGTGVVEASKSIRSILLGDNASEYYITEGVNNGKNIEVIVDLVFFLIFFIMIPLIASRKYKNKNKYFNAALGAAFLFGGRRGGGSGGGFGGFGGGGFGGGGASGGW